MNLDELQSVRSKERRTDSLQHLRDSFYEDVRDYLAELKTERDAAAERADDPFASPEVRQLTDEIESAKEVVEAVYERRMGKLVKHASLVAAGMDPDDEGMTTEERELFFDLVDRIQANKRTVLGTIEGDPDDAEDENAPADDPEPDAAEGVSAAAAMAGDDRADPTVADPTTGESTTDTGTADHPTPTDENAATADPHTPASGAGTPGDGGASESPPTDDPGTRPPPSSADPDVTGEAVEPAEDAPGDGPRPDEDAVASPETDERMTLRITADVGEILGVDDRAYDLEREDVVALPRQNAEPLLEREAAERLE